MDVPKIDMEPVPVMEITKAGSFTDTGSEIPRRVETKADIKLSIKDDQDEKSIASDSELMKILEEDSTHSDESRIINKKEGLMNTKDSHILLDALTSGNSDIKEKNIATSDIKTESAGTVIHSKKIIHLVLCFLIDSIGIKKELYQRYNILYDISDTMQIY